MDEYIRAKIERENAATSRRLHQKNSPCNSDSHFHDLRCGHRIRTEHPEDCGANCAKPHSEATTPSRFIPFICHTCIVSQAHTEIGLAGLTLKDGPSRNEKSLSIIQKVVKQHLDHGFRPCSPVKKEKDGVMQFFAEFAADVESENRATGQMDAEVLRKFKRPSVKASPPKPTAKNSMRAVDSRWAMRKPGKTAETMRWNPYVVPDAADIRKDKVGRSTRNPMRINDPDLEALFGAEGLRSLKTRNLVTKGKKAPTRPPNKKDEGGAGDRLEPTKTTRDKEDAATKALREVLEMMGLGSSKDENMEDAC